MTPRLAEVNGMLADWQRGEEILERAAALHGFEPEDLTGGKRSPDLVWARHLAIAATRRATFLSLSEIGRLFSKDHTSILYACHKIERLASVNPGVQAQLWELTIPLSKDRSG